ncbi:MAG: translocation/assembly module TamB domain-containing protein [Cytophagaceae bacterium]|nr:translocation/assembly module TamB domain-containing protein [Cytophagaceae bacterium]
MRKAFIILFRVLFSLLLLVVLLLAGVTLSLRQPAVQTRVVRILADSISQKLGYPISIGRVNYKWFDKLALDSVSIRDTRQQPMIDVERVEIDFKLSNLVFVPQDSLKILGMTFRYKNYLKLTASDKLSLDRVRLLQPNVRLAVNSKTGDLNIDEFIARINELIKPKTPSLNPSPDPPFSIDQASLENATVRYDDPRAPTLNRKGTFDYNHFTVNELHADLTDFLLVADTVAMQIDNLRGIDNVANLRIRELDTKFLFSKKQLRFDDLLAKINQSTLRRRIVFRYQRSADLSDFNNKVYLEADLDSSVVLAHDLARFARSLYDFNDVWMASGRVNGRVGDFRVTNANLYFGKQSHVLGTLAFRGLPDFETTDMDFNLRQTVVNPADLEQYLGKNTTASIQKFGTVRFDATFAGRYNDFRTKGIFLTALGRAEPNLSMTLASKSARSTYSGHVKLVDFSLGKLIGNEGLLQQADLSGRVEGRGFSVEDAVLNFDGYIARIGIRGYNYRRAYANGELQKGLFDGQVTLRDTNLVFDLAGRVDLRQRRNAFNLAGKLTRANLLPLGFANEDVRVQSDLKVDFVGLNPDSMYGTARLLNTYVTIDKRSLIVDSLFVFAPRPTFRVDAGLGMSVLDRRLEIRSNLLDASAHGPFQFSQVARDLPRLIEEYRIYFLENEAARREYYARRAALLLPRYTIDYNVLLKNTAPLMAFFYPTGYLSPNTRLEGQLRLGNTSVFTVNALADTLILDDYKFYGSEIDLNTSKFANAPDVLASLILSSKSQKLNVLAPTENLEVEGSWEQDQIAFTSSLRQSDSPNRANLNGTVRFTSEGTELRFRRSRVRLQEGDWTLDPGNLIALAGASVNFKNVIFRNVEQSLAVGGIVSPDSMQALNLKAQDFRLETITQVANLDLKGTLNAAVTVRDVYKNLNVEGSVNVDELVYQKFLIGNISGETKWDRTRRQVNVSAAIDRMNNRIVSVKGVYDPKKDENSLNLTATLSQTNLEILEPFTKGIFSNLSGTASGQVRIQGTPVYPLLTGSIDVRRGRLLFNYLKSTLRFEDKIYFDGDAITVRRLRLTDEEGNPGTLTGGIFYDGAGNFATNLRATLSNFRVMNTTARDNALFYGTAYVTTTGPDNLEILGPLDNLRIKARATTNRNTRIYIPFDNAASVSTDDFITLLSEKIKQDSIRVQEAKNEKITPTLRRDESRILMDFDFSITPDAYCEIQLNRQTGESISANGQGRLRLGVDTQGDFTMSGTYTIQQGKYSFKYANLIDKPFDIRAGSRISWAGDPYEANIDIKAAYRQLISFNSIMQLSESEQKDPQYQRRYPVAVVINLSDRLLSPSISYALELKDYPKSGPFVRDIPAFEARLQSDEQELSRQVSSVLAFGQLIPANSNQSFGQVNVLNNLTELAANQLSSWLSQIDPNLQINYLSFNGNSTTTNQAFIGDPRASISYNFRDRIRITRDGGFTNSTYTGNANLIGDWSVEVLITKDGRWRGKAFNRFVQNPFTGTFNNQTVANFGASVLYTQSFNYFFKPAGQVPTLRQPFRYRPPADPLQPVEAKPAPTTTSQVVPGKQPVQK